MESPPEQNSDEPFGPSCRKDIGAILRLANDPNFPAFWEKVSLSGKAMRRALQLAPSGFGVSPFDMSATQRITWLERNVVHPAVKLEGALLPENHSHFIHWEDVVSNRNDDSPRSDKDDLQLRLNALVDQAKKLIAKLKSDLDMKVQTTDEIRFSIVFDAIHDLHDFYPDFPLSRGNWDQEIKQTIGTLPEFVRRIFFEVTGHHEQLDGPIQLVLKDM